MAQKTVGILGGGQLGKMLAIAAAELGLQTHVYCPEEDSPAFSVASHITQNRYDNTEALLQFARSVDVVTYEFENIPYIAIHAIEGGAPVHPGWQALQLSQNRIREKQFMRQLEMDVTPFYAVNNLEDLINGFDKLDTDCILKTAELGYDGKGQCWIDSNSNLEAIWNTFDQKEAILEAFVPFETELSIIIARSTEGKMATFPVSENTHKDGILIQTIAPAILPAEITHKAIEIAATIATALQIVGLLTVELFYTDEGTLLVNEIAPRPHNSGHWTLDGCDTSQFEQCIRAICGMPLGSTNAHTRIRMENLLGDTILEIPRYMVNPRAKVHLYGKKVIKQGRKMGHINYLEERLQSKLSVTPTVLEY